MQNLLSHLVGGSIDELITTGYNGLLAKRGDILDFAEKMKLLLENPELRRDMGKHARETIVEKDPGMQEFNKILQRIGRLLAFAWK